jgi:hypothetical protein
MHFFIYCMYSSMVRPPHGWYLQCIPKRIYFLYYCNFIPIFITNLCFSLILVDPTPSICTYGWEYPVYWLVYSVKVVVVASIKYTHNCNGVFLKLKLTTTFLKYAKIAMASIQLTLKFLTVLVSAWSLTWYQIPSFHKLP